MALLCLRSTPIDHHLPSPAELLYNKRIVSNLPAKCPNPLLNRDEVRDRLEQRQKAQKQNFDKTAKDLHPLMAGQKVTLQHPVSGKWVPGTVADKCPEPRSYMEETAGNKEENATTDTMGPG